MNIDRSYLTYMLCAVWCLYGATGQAQNYSMSSGVISTCSGTFFDSGGSAGNYAANENRTYTICPTNASQNIRVTFTSFNVEAGFDLLRIYEGLNTSTLIGTYSNSNSPNGQSFTSSANSGCLTFVFTSNATNQFSGWSATLSCITPPLTAEICNNGRDDDGDGLVDGYDPDCFPSTVPTCGTTGSSRYYGVLANCQYPPPTASFALQELWASQANSEATSRSFALAGDLDGDCIPEVVFTNQGSEYGSSSLGIVIANGATGATKHLISDGGGTDFSGSCGISLADVDANGKGDILFYDRDGAILRYEWDGITANLIYKKTRTDGSQPLSRRAANGYSTISNYKLSNSIADINHDGIPEMVIGNQVFNAVNGHELCAGSTSDPVGSRSDRINTSALVDVIGNGDLDLVVGNAVYTINIPPGGIYGTGTITKTLNMSPTIPGDGYVAIADMDEDGDLDVVSIVGTRMYIWDPSTGTLLASLNLPGSGEATSPTVGDIDNRDPDGAGWRTRDMEILYHRNNFIYAIKWDPVTLAFTTMATAASNDASETTITLFDFQGDGKVDILYRDENNLRMLSYNGTATLQDIVAAVPCASSTSFEHPMALDVTGDGQTELVCDCGGKIRAFGSSNLNVPLIPSRRVWNQWSYFVVNINDNLTVPRYQQKHSVNKGLNTFWQQLPLWDPVSDQPVRAAADAVPSIDSVKCAYATTNLTVYFKISNNGNAALPLGMYVSFYREDPQAAGSIYLGRTQVPTTLPAGASTNLTFTFAGGTPTNLFVMANDDGSGTLPYVTPPRTHTECNYTNNKIQRNPTGCSPPPTAVCQNITIQLNASGAATIVATAIDGGSWDDGSITNYAASQTNFNCSHLGPNSVTLTVTDNNGLTAQCTATVTVQDLVLPQISCPANITAPASAGTCGAVVNYTAPVGTDNCSGASTTRISGPASGSTFPVGVTTITYRVTDGSGNSANCSFTVTVNDTQNPAITCPSNIVATNAAGTCGAVVTYTAPVGTDNCSGATTTQIAGLASGSTFPVGNTTNTFRVTDAGGRTATCSFTVTVVDQQNPTISCPANITVGNAVGTCGAVVTYTAPVGTDNCPGSTTTQIAGLASGATFPIGTTTNTFRVVDGASRTATCSFTVTVNDTENPAISCPANIVVVNAPGTCGEIVNYTAPIGTDNCPGATTAQIAGLASGSTFPVGTTVNTFRVTDAAGRTGTCSFNIVVNDTELPTIACPANISVSNAAGTCGAVVAYAAPVGTDNCAGATTARIAGLASGATFPVGATTNTFRVTDASGNTATCSFTVTVNDTQLPVISCPANITVPNAAGTCGAVVAYTAPVGTDNCPGASTSQIAGLVSGATFPVGTTTNTFRVTDASGNIATCSFTVTVNDTQLPAISCPANITVPNDAGTCGAVVGYTAPVGTDNCPGASTTRIAGLASGATFPVGTTTNTFRVTDALGNTATCSFTVTVNDTQLPVISCPANITVPNAAGTCGVVVAYTAPVGTDNCPGATTTQIAGLASGATFPLGTTTNTFRVTDGAGNTATCSFTVTVNDTQLPVISCPANITVSNAAGTCGAAVAYTAPVGTDNCPGASTTQIAGLASGATFPVGTTTNTFRVTDASGNIATCSFTVTVDDTQLPAISCPANITAPNAAGTCGAVVAYTAPVGTDNCPGATTTQIAGLASGATFPVGTTTNTFRVTDAADNTATCSFTVTVNDTQLPVISCPANITVPNAAGTCGAVVAYTAPVGTDNCAGATTTQIAGLVSGATFPVGTTTNTFRVTDAAGNTATCSFTVTVNDTQLPVISCQANTTVSNAAGTCGAIVAYTAPVGTDNCPGSSTTQIAGLASGATFPVGTTTNTFRVTDAAGNSATCSFTVTVNDTQAPAITCPANIIVSNDVGACGAVVSFTAPVGTDNCSGAVTTLRTPLGPGATFPVGTSTVTYRVTDAVGLFTECSFTVRVNDTQAPAITCPANIIISNDVGACGAVVSFAAPIGTDNCSGAVTTLRTPLGPGATFPIGTSTVTYRVTDAAGLFTECSFTVRVNDTQAPAITCPANIVVSNDVGACGAVVSFTAPIGTDNCPGALTTLRTPLGPGATFPIGISTVTYRVTDAAGLFTECSFTVRVNDTENPVISCPANIIVNVDAGSCSAVVNYTAPVGTDNCPGATTTRIAGPASGSTFAPGTTTITYRVTDAAGNTTTCSFTVTVTPGNDNDGDGVCDNVDLDDDNDGIPDIDEGGDALDTDGDGIPNRFDLDSDNDGIYDVVEAGSGQPFINGVLNGAVTATGIPVAVDADANNVVDYTIRDSDSDGNIDSLELDSDSDGCYDVVEAGYIDHDGDGRLGNSPLTTDPVTGLVTSTGF